MINLLIFISYLQHFRIYIGKTKIILIVKTRNIIPNIFCDLLFIFKKHQRKDGMDLFTNCGHV